MCSRGPGVRWLRLCIFYYGLHLPGLPRVSPGCPSGLFCPIPGILAAVVVPRVTAKGAPKVALVILGPTESSLLGAPPGQPAGPNTPQTTTQTSPKPTPTALSSDSCSGFAIFALSKLARTATARVCVRAARVCPHIVIFHYYHCFRAHHKKYHRGMNIALK